MNRPNCYLFFVPEGKFMQYWDNNVVDFEKTEGGWIFWVIS